MLDDRQLLDQYVKENSEAAFAALVGKHLGLVYTAALRQVRKPELAEEVAQLVFTNLARKAATLSPNSVLAGWLHRDTRFTALDLLRSEPRRRAREQEALTRHRADPSEEVDWEKITPWLDEALQELKGADRDALLLRFFENHSLNEIAAKLRIGEEAARKRVVRALDKLRALLARRGVTTSQTALAVALATHGVQAVPSGLAATISTASLAATGGLATIHFLKLITMTTLKTTALAALALAGITTAVIEHRTKEKLRAEFTGLQSANLDLEKLRAENARLSNQVARVDPPMTKEQFAELLRLRSEAGRLRAELKLATKLKAVTNEGSMNYFLAPSVDASKLKNPYAAMLVTTLANHQSLVTGGWATPPGKRTFVLVTPDIPAGDPHATEAAKVNFKTTTVAIPESDVAEFGWDNLRAETQTIPVQKTYSPADAEQLEALLNAAHDNTNWTVTHGQILTSEGMEANMSFGKDISPDGAMLGANYSISLNPTLTPDHQSVMVGINARVESAHALNDTK